MKTISRGRGRGQNREAETKVVNNFRCPKSTYIPLCIDRGQMLKTKAEDKILASRPA